MTALVEARASISVELYSAEKNKTRKTRAEAKIDVIPNWAERPVRACPECIMGLWPTKATWNSAVSYPIENTWMRKRSFDRAKPKGPQSQPA